MGLNLILTALATLLVSANAFAHGEDRPGPNGGFVKMPGAYHTEVVPAGKGAFKIFLLDVNWEKPTLKNSFVKIIHSAKEKKLPAKCVPKENSYYFCSLPKGVDLTSEGSLLVESQREGQTGGAMTYTLPLQLTKAKGHENH